MATGTTTWDGLRSHLREIEVLSGVQAVMAWDQQTMMPSAGAANRGEQSALMSRLVHERLTDPRVGDWLNELRASTDLSETQVATLRNVGRSYEQAVKVPSELVSRLARAQADGFGAWASAKESGDYEAFKPALNTLLELVRERAACLNSDLPPYQVILDDFNPGTDLVKLEATFSRLARGLSELIQAVADVSPMPKLSETFEVANQQGLMRTVAETIGYDFQGGRLDDSEHPFTISMGPGDVRITTHLYDDDLLGGLGGTVHEAGHGMYEQGLPHDLRGTMVNSAASLGLHESQSRFWENYIGRSKPFFEWMMGPLRAAFPHSQVSADDLYRAANRVEPSFIRVTADEVTYNLHIIIRFELEKAFVDGELHLDDLPDAWSAKYRQYLGVNPPNHSMGVLQDVHWSSGAFGYFPSYTIGNLYAASLGATLTNDLPDLWEQVGRGEFGAILSWLRKHIHSQGHLLDAPDRMQAVVGDRDSVDDLLTYLWGRHGALHGVRRSN